MYVRGKNVNKKKKKSKQTTVRRYSLRDPWQTGLVVNLQKNNFSKSIFLTECTEFASSDAPSNSGYTHLAALTSGGDIRGSQTQVHGHLRSHGQQVVLEGLLHQTLLLFRQSGHLPLWPLSHTRLQLFSELLQRGGSGQTGNLLLTQGQRHGGSRRHDGGGKIIWKREREKWRFGLKKSGWVDLWWICK